MRRSIVRRATYSARSHAGASVRPSAGGGEERRPVGGGGGRAAGPRHRAAVGPVRSPAVRHRCSWMVAQKEGPLSFGSGPGDPSLTAPYAARSLPPEGQAGIRVGLAFAAQRFTWYLPDE